MIYVSSVATATDMEAGRCIVCIKCTYVVCLLASVASSRAVI